MFALQPEEAATLPEWRVSPGLTDYAAAAAALAARAQAIVRGEAKEQVWLLEHPPVYTLGASTQAGDYDSARIGTIPVLRAPRGGRITYHGPGQRVMYLNLDLRRRRRDVGAFIGALEATLIDALAALGAPNPRRDSAGRGVWIGDPPRKAAAIGVRLSRWVSSHGVSLNLAPNLAHYQAIAPCGMNADSVASLAAYGLHPSMDEVDAALLAAFRRVFGAIRQITKPRSF